ncbi:MAG: pilus assembly PilX N-terminal domain-containing protein [Candidatus Latescibacterota bacterium]
MSRIISKTLKDEKGSALVVTLLVLFAVSVIGATLSKLSSTDLKVAGNQRMSADALYAAEAGLTEAIHRLALADPTNVTVGGSSINAAISDSPPYDPDWQTRIFLDTPGNAAKVTGSIVSTGTIQDPSQPYILYSRPSGTDDILTIVHKWQDRDADGNRDADEVVLYDGTVIPPENFDSGFPVEIITVPGRVGMGERVIQAEVTRRTLNARTLGALYVDKAIKVTGTPDFCGYNHALNTPVGTVLGGCSGWHTGAGDLVGVATTGDVVNMGGAADADGYPSPIDTSSSNPFYSLPDVLGLTQSEVDQMLAQADQTTITNPLNGITYIDGDAKINSNLSGTGLIYITGDLSGNGDMDFKGLIYVEGDVKLNGSAWILGSLIVRGTTDYNFSAGNAAVLYSEDAIKNYLGQAMPIILLSWREL